MKEIERKFLVDPEKFSVTPIKETKFAVEIQQGYLSTDPCVRIRIVKTPKTHKFIKALLTIKGQGTIERDEFEYEIPEHDAIIMFEMAKHKLSKLRFYVKNENAVWEVDSFMSPFGLMDLWLAEVELTSKHQMVTIPDWIIKEVTEDTRYANVNLAKNGKVSK
ncbi:MAG TPA: CYTH domain-containing protein [Candidatus Glassbacteria bacterium]|nr:CYTH domain-containing protein [Candidatus Glassbacteria bacterium]